MRVFEPEVVLHMAAQSVVLTSYEEPGRDLLDQRHRHREHAGGGARLKRPCSSVNVTTDKCYENKRWVWGYRENDPLGGRDPYSNSKACAELVGATYRDSFFPLARFEEHGVAIASARAGNVVGGGDWTARPAWCRRRSRPS